MTRLRNSERQRLLDPDAFLWCTGIEDTFVTAPWQKTGRTLDEYELTGHYDRWRDDLRLIAELRVSAARYGIPWHRINPARGVWDWSWADAAIDRLLELGIEPIVDLVHYGLPAWIEKAYLNPDFAERMAEYAGRAAERWRGKVFAYTPLNEPRITAWYCGRIGWWPPFGRSWKSFVTVMDGVCRGIVRTVQTLKSVDPEILIAHVDATDLYDTDDPGLDDEAQHRQEIVFLALDLVSGRVGEGHRLRSWLSRQGLPDESLAWFSDNAVELPLIGINLYPMFTQKRLLRSGSGRFRIAMPYADGRLIDRLAAMYWERYHAPLFISETASVGAVKRRRAWMEESLVAVRRVREQGIGLVGYTWWPLFALVTWAYRQGTNPPPYYLKQMGLWDLDERLNRISTELVPVFRRHVEAGSADVGRRRSAAAETRATRIGAASAQSVV
ncbi:glycoside hydrolase [Opitutaceae bacterium EW11]|nr:glycoside hydrolase [Opitutaceae bacterium EW11]